LVVPIGVEREVPRYERPLEIAKIKPFTRFGANDLSQTMKEANEFEDQESVVVSTNHLLALFSDADRVANAVKALHDNGFSSDDIGTLAGAEGVAKVDAASGKQGLFAKLLTSGVDMGDRDSAYIKEYRNAMLKGETVVAVVAKDDAKSRAKQILHTQGARFITFFGRFATEVLKT
jgi:hypothetical protein